MGEIEMANSGRLTDMNKRDSQKNNILVLGIGNYLMGDEGVGVHLIHKLINEKSHLINTDILDGGVGGFTLMGYFDEYQHVIIVDATMDGKKAGTISVIKPKFASDFPPTLTAHDFGLKDMVESMYLLGRIPELYLVTVSIDEIKPMCIDLSSELQNATSELAEKVRDLVNKITMEDA